MTPCFWNYYWIHNIISVDKRNTISTNKTELNKIPDNVYTLNYVFIFPFRFIKARCFSAYVLVSAFARAHVCMCVFCSNIRLPRTRKSGEGYCISNDNNIVYFSGLYNSREILCNIHQRIIFNIFPRNGIKGSRFEIYKHNRLFHFDF